MNVKKYSKNHKKIVTVLNVGIKRNQWYRQTHTQTQNRRPTDFIFHSTIPLTITTDTSWENEKCLVNLLKLVNKKLWNGKTTKLNQVWLEYWRQS